MRFSSLFVLPAMMCGLAVAAEPEMTRTDPASQGVDPDSLAQIGELLQGHVDDGLIAGAVAGVARHGQIAYLESFGWQDVEQQQPMRVDSIFQIRSMSKPVTAVAALQLIEQGRLSLDDPVSAYIPRFGHMFVYLDPEQPFLSAQRKPQREATIRDLLLNTAGLSHRNSALYRQLQVRSRAETLERLVDRVAGVPLIGDPGEQWVYSISITVLGRVVELVSGQTLDEYLEEHVFTPLGMQDSGFFVSADKVDRLARVYQVPEEDAGLARIADMDIPITQDPPLLEGAAGMVSSVPDYLQFLQALLNGGEFNDNRILEQGTVSEMVRNQVDESLFPFGSNPERPMLDRGWGYGLAVVVDATQSDFGVNNGEFGWNGSLGTFSWADPQTGTVAILMLQVQPAGAYGLSGRFKDLVYNAIDANRD